MNFREDKDSFLDVIQDLVNAFFHKKESGRKRAMDRVAFKLENPRFNSEHLIQFVNDIKTGRISLLLKEREERAVRPSLNKIHKLNARAWWANNTWEEREKLLKFAVENNTDIVRQRSIARALSKIQNRIIPNKRQINTYYSIYITVFKQVQSLREEKERVQNTGEFIDKLSVETGTEKKRNVILRKKKG